MADSIRLFHEEVVPIHDALANVCVTEPMGLVIAIGLQLQLQQEKICSTIVENGRVKEGLVAY